MKAPKKQKQLLVDALDRFILRSQGNKPSLAWASDFVTLRSKMRLLSRYEFEPAFFDKAIQLLCRRVSEGNIVSVSILTLMRAWFNKAKGFRANEYRFHREKQVDLKSLLGLHYSSTRDGLFYLFSKLVFDDKRKEVVSSFINELELTRKQQQWLIDNWAADPVILKKLLHYSFPSPLIGKWAIEKGMQEGSLLPHLSKLVGHALAYDTDYLLTVRTVKQSMAAIKPFWMAVEDFYEEIMDFVREPHQSIGVANARKRLGEIGTQGMGWREIFNCMEDCRNLHPAYHYHASFLSDLVPMGLKFKLFPNQFNQVYLTTVHFWSSPKEDWYEYAVDPVIMFNDGFPEQHMGQSVRNFYRAYHYVDIEATVAEWYEQADKVRTKCFYEGIFKSKLSQAEKNKLYQHYYDPELKRQLYRYILKEKM